MKKQLKLWTCAVMLLCIAACGGKNAKVPTQESTSQAPSERTSQASQETTTEAKEIQEPQEPQEPQKPQKPQKALYTSGTYTGEANGYGGKVTVTITVDDSSITDVAIEGANETPAIGGAALEELAGQIKDAQSSKIDGVTGATMTSSAVKTAAESAINEAMGK